MVDSILNSIKKVLGIAEDYTAFDADIIMHINSVFSTLYELGVGPTPGFHITGKDEKWSDFLGDESSTIQSVRTYVYLRVRLLFDPPSTSFAIAAMEKQIQELEWRLNAQREEARYPWVDPLTTSSSTTE